ncbi:type IV secretory system conjugative DNA transfer family protein [Solwaraspora sp. WMMB335]|uniref:type IV secretory system conjugative DNA transfer family protein n=1 Tax=Solwaraspora sp. WMMB335 TaxID=3404118 RepID=UPI003B95DC1D
MSASSEDESKRLLYLVLAMAGGCGGTGWLFWLAGQVSAFLTGQGWPDSSPNDIVAILRALVATPGDPARAWPEPAAGLIGPAWLVYSVFLVLLLIASVAAVAAIRFAWDWRRRRGFRWARLGFASGWEIARTIGRRPIVRRARFTRPTMAGKPGLRPEDVGYCLGRDVRSLRKVYSSVEDAMLVVAPPRQGKDVHFVAPFTIDAPGSCIVLSTELESFTTTYAMRTAVGRVTVFDPNNLTNWPNRIRMCLVRGSDNPNTADDRATTLAKYAGYHLGGETKANIDSGYFSPTAVIVILRCYLHAAALSGGTIADVLRWVRRQTDPEPLDLLRRAEAAGAAAPGWAAELASLLDTDQQTRAAMWASAAQSLRFLSDPAVLANYTPGPDEEFDIKEFVSGHNTLYYLVKETGANPQTPAVHILIETIWSKMAAAGAQLPGGRLEPPATVEVNEAIYCAPMSSLPRYMALLGKSSIAVHVYLRSISQAREKYGESAVRTMWDNAAVRVVVGGAGNITDLEEVSKLLGNVRRPSGLLSDANNEVLSPVLTAEELRTMEFGRAVVVGREVRPIEVRLTPWWRRRDAKRIKAGKQSTEQLVLRYAAPPAAPRRREQVPAGEWPPDRR